MKRFIIFDRGASLTKGGSDIKLPNRWLILDAHAYSDNEVLPAILAGFDNMTLARAALAGLEAYGGRSIADNITGLAVIKHIFDKDGELIIDIYPKPEDDIMFYDPKEVSKGPLNLLAEGPKEDICGEVLPLDMTGMDRQGIMDRTFTVKYENVVSRVTDSHMERQQLGHVTQLHIDITIMVNNIMPYEKMVKGIRDGGLSFYYRATTTSVGRLLRVATWVGGCDLGFKNATSQDLYPGFHQQWGGS